MESQPVLRAGVDRLLAGCSQAQGPRQVVDLGGGTGGYAVRLAVAGHEVTVVDPSPDALAALSRRAADADVADRLRGIQGDAESLGDVIAEHSVDLVLCHGVLEVVDDPALALAAIKTVLRPSGRLSLLVAQRDAAVLARVVSGNLRAANALLHDDAGRWGADDPLLRRFTRSQLIAMLDEAALHPLDFEGVQVFSELAPVASTVSDPSATSVLSAMEVEASTIPALAGIAARLHVHVAAEPVA